MHVPELWVESLELLRRHFERSKQLCGDRPLVLGPSVMETGRLDLEQPRDDTNGVHGVNVLLVEDEPAVATPLPRPGVPRSKTC